MAKRKPYRVIVWGPGGIGGACLREIARLPEMELVGVYAYSAEKAGKDAGPLVGIAPLGVVATNDKAAILALEADCVLHTSRPTLDPAEMDADVIALLESGKNVVSSASYHYPQLHGSDYVRMLEAACRKGNATLHGSGVNPGFIVERIAIPATGACNRLQHLRVQEIVDLSHNSNEGILRQFGFGALPSEIDSEGPVSKILNRYYYREVVALATRALFGCDPERIEHTPGYTIAEHEIETAAMRIHPGTVARISHAFTGYLDGKARVTMELHWYQLRENCPFPDVRSSDHWKIEIEGEPCSLHLGIDAKASFDRNLERYDDDPTIATYYVTAVAMLQSVPRVVAAPPGLLFPSAFAHRVHDLRDLEQRRSVLA